MRHCVVVLVMLLAAEVHASEAVYLMRGPLLPVSRSVNGHTTEVRPHGKGWVEVRVTASLQPIGAEGTLAELRSTATPQVPVGFRLPPDLAGLLHGDMTAWEAATEILMWVSDHLKLIDDDQRPQDAISVLRRGGGRCSGLANATAALLLAAGFEARTLSGLLVEGHEAIPHRWVECRLPGAGWVPTDPTLGWWTVTAGHVPFRQAVDRLPDIEVVKAPAAGFDRLPKSRRGLLRPNDGAELVCRLRESAAGRRVVATLASDTESRQLDLDPEGRFESLLPGWWVLVVEVDGRVVERRRLRLAAGAVLSYAISIPETQRKEVGS